MAGIALGTALVGGCGDATPTAAPPPPETGYRMERISGQDQRDETGALLAVPLTVRVTDSTTGAPAPSLVVLFTPSTGSGVLSADSAVTDAAGLASVRWTIGPGDGTASHVTATLRRAPRIAQTFDAIAATERVRAVALGSGAGHACAILVSKRVACWGANGMGQLGDGTGEVRSFAVLVAGAPIFQQLAVGGVHTCGLTSSGDAWCWGANFSGQLGDGSLTSRRTIVRAAAGLKFAQLVAGTAFTCGVTAPGDVYCWGQLDRAFNATQPQEVSRGVRFRTLGRAGTQACGVGLDDVSRCFAATMTTDGVNGGPGLAWRPQAAPLPGLTGFVGLGISACALDPSGAAFCWGDNEFGQLGIGDGRAVTGPQRVTGGHFYQRLYDGFENTCGVTTAGATYCWGHNRQGQLGAPPGGLEGLPTPVGLDAAGTLSFASLAGGTFHFCGLATDTTVYCWGGNPEGALGDGTEPSLSTVRTTPRPVLLR